MPVTELHPTDDNLPFWRERVDLAAAFRWTVRELAVISGEIAAKVAQEAQSMGIEAHRHLDSIKTLLDRSEPDYRD